MDPLYSITQFPKHAIIEKILCEELKKKNIGEPITHNDIGQILLKIKKATDKPMISSSDLEPGLKKYRVAFIDGKSTLAVDDIVSMVSVTVTTTNHNTFVDSKIIEITRYLFLRLSDLTTHETRTSKGYILVEEIEDQY